MLLGSEWKAYQQSQYPQKGTASEGILSLFKIGIKCFSRFLLVAHGPKPSPKASYSQTNHTVNRQRRQKRNQEKLMETSQTF